VADDQGQQHQEPDGGQAGGEPLASDGFAQRVGRANPDDHQHEQEQHQHRAGVDDDLHGRQEWRARRRVQHRQREHHHGEQHRAVHRPRGQDHPERGRHRHDGEHPEHNGRGGRRRGAGGQHHVRAHS
jgi:hypothetical protein